MDLKLKRPQGIGRWLQIYQLYMEAFPASERKPFGMIRRMYRKGTTDIWCLERPGSFAGIGITINGPDLILLDYFAVRKPLRGSQDQTFRCEYGAAGKQLDPGLRCLQGLLPG